MKLRVTDFDVFQSSVFGAESFIELLGVNRLASGFDVSRDEQNHNSENLYVLDDQGNIINDIAFFCEEEINACMEFIDTASSPDRPDDKSKGLESCRAVSAITNIDYVITDTNISVTGNVNGRKTTLLVLTKSKTKGSSEWYATTMNMPKEASLAVEYARIYAIALELPFGNLK